MSEPTNLDELAALMAEAIDSTAPALTSAELNTRSLDAFAGGRAWSGRAPEPGASRLDIRLHGPAIDGHLAPVRLATKALTVFQDLVSVVGMAQRGKKSISGAIPTEIAEATQLNLSPNAAPGSLIFELRGPAAVVDDGQIAGADTGVNLADTAAVEIFSLLDRAAHQDADLLAELQRLGPRVATHLRRLNALTLNDSLFLDMRWEKGDGSIVEGQAEESSAVELERVITESRVTSERERLFGHLVTISTEDKLVLRDRSGHRIPLVESEDFVQDPADFYDKDVVAEVDVEVEVHPTTGRDVRTHYLVSLALDRPESFEPVGLNI